MNAALQLIQPIPASSKTNDLQLQHAIEQFLYGEAQLLDHRAYEAWFALFEKDMRYFMPLRTNRMLRDAELEYSGDHDFAHFDETWETMYGRIRKVTAEVGWAENPPSRTRHLVSNIIVHETSEPDVYDVSSAFILYRNRLERQMDIFAGERRDVLRRADNDLGFRIARRTILIDQSTILSNNMSMFF
ncbi:aromatic-ring-hydroxylating dioxygenase subunit beta [Dyella ginsengisoli]|uniref:Biphenyl dioxygenase small subunit n=1 Tax=Dyella ginsengisoli TaxID=363848 RepID=A9QT31_9GAMM|nr:aromatic-ring-hydroxylating dioxygenase subunit beta [Dyella ginsengisoli]ABX56039.1 biphenyl dioxygenase small subunit [Dyella ginsengisoli LA-4]